MWRRYILRIAVCLTITLSGCQGILAQTSIVIFNTGIDDNNHLLPVGAPDPHYTLIRRPGKEAIQAHSYASKKDTPWSALGPNSNWIVPDETGAGNTDTGTFVYRTTFDLSGFDATTAVITGIWGIDDSGEDILLNGISMACVATDGKSVTKSFDLANVNSFTITKGFISGINTLDFVVRNGWGPSALRVELSGRASGFEPSLLAYLKRVHQAMARLDDRKDGLQQFEKTVTKADALRGQQILSKLGVNSDYYAESVFIQAYYGLDYYANLDRLLRPYLLSQTDIKRWEQEYHGVKKSSVLGNYKISKSLKL